MITIEKIETMGDTETWLPKRMKVERAAPYPVTRAYCLRMEAELERRQEKSIKEKLAIAMGISIATYYRYRDGMSGMSVDSLEQVKRKLFTNEPAY